MPIPTPVIKGAGTDGDKSSCPAKITVKGAKVVTAKAEIRKTSPANAPAGKPPNQRGAVSLTDEGPAKVVKTISTKVTMEGENPCHATCTYQMNMNGAGNTMGLQSDGENDVTVGV